LGVEEGVLSLSAAIWYVIIYVKSECGNK